ncbi:MAG: hypothetical protein V7739_09325 [Motiliproteus sp.]
MGLVSPKKTEKRLQGFDIFVLAGGLMNLLVIGSLVGFWLLH